MEFREFLHVFRKVASERRQDRVCKKKEENTKMSDFTSNTMDNIDTMLGIQGKIEQGISFRLGMSIYRRKHLINAIMSKKQG